MTNKEAINFLRGKMKLLGELNYVYSEEDYALDMAIKALEQQEKEGWIPVSEGLPERDINSFGDTLSHSKEVLVIVKYDSYGDDGEQYIAWFDNDKYDMYKESSKTGECDDSVVPEKEAWRVYNKGTCSSYEDLFIKSVIAWKPMPEPYKSDEF